MPSDSNYFSNLMTFLTAAFSCFAALAACYSATENERHRMKINRQRADIVFLPRGEYKGAPPAQLSFALSETDSLKYFAGQLCLLPIDNVIYIGGNIDMTKFSPYGVRNMFMVTRYFEIGYVTIQGRRKWKKYKRGTTNGNINPEE